jgi:RimJ/RimL family protein N-acetyltransferase
MKHDLSAEGYAYNLRPVTLDDAEFILQLRAGDSERTKYLHPVKSDVEVQRAWLQDYFSRENDYYFVVTQRSTGTPEGLVAVYDVDPEAQCAEWGRWILKPGSFAAPESALLAYKIAFETLGLEHLYCITVSGNQSVLSFHDSCGLVREEVLEGRFQLADGRHDGIKHGCRRSQWPELRQKLDLIASRIGKRMAPK